jgi:hypothetical protein
MWKAVLAGTTALTIAGAAVVHAQPQRQGRPDGMRRWQPSVEDMRAFADARLAALRAGLTLTAEQQRHWPAFEQAARALQKLRLDRANAMRAARRDGQPQAADPVERLRQRAARLSETGAALRNFAEAMGPLYASLDEAQKRRFAVLGRMAGPRPGMRNRQRGPQPGWNRGRGPRPQGRDNRRSELAPPTSEPAAPMFGRMPLDGAAQGLTFGRKTVTDRPAVNEAAYGLTFGRKAADTATGSPLFASSSRTAPTSAHSAPRAFRAKTEVDTGAATMQGFGGIAPSSRGL